MIFKFELVILPNINLLLFLKHSESWWFNLKKFLRWSTKHLITMNLIVNLLNRPYTAIAEFSSVKRNISKAWCEVNCKIHDDWFDTIGLVVMGFVLTNNVFANEKYSWHERCLHWLPQKIFLQFVSNNN